MFRLIFIIILTTVVLFPEGTNANNQQKLYEQRLQLYKKTAAISNVPWYYIAAIDQYERNKQSNEEEPLIAITFEPVKWYGIGNLQEKNAAIIRASNGIGLDGNGDGLADPNDPEDVLYTMASYITKDGFKEEDIKIALWEYYKKDLTVKTIMNNAKVFQFFKTTILTDRSFPVDTNYIYNYKSSWGAGRGFGGNRIHEGTDIFAHYGTPVKSTTYGVVELKGWNLYGGWRVGIRDIYNIYHYYAHLQNYEDGIEIGKIVKPGDLIGTVGATGYGPPGTSGKFPPHLHYGMYQYNGKNEWAFDPFPYLQRWERME